MKIVQNDGTRMVLEGVPQGRGLWFAAAVCVALVAASGLFAAVMLTKSKSIWNAAGVLAACGFSLLLLVAVVGFSLRRERLTIDKVTKAATHRTWSVVFGGAKERAYPMDRVHGVAVQRTMQASGGGKGFPTRVTTARLLLTKPRKGIDLDEKQGGDEAPVIALAEEVAVFLGTPVTQLGQHED